MQKTEIKSKWLRDFTPLTVGAILLIVILAVLPSALNLPQTNPTETLEYAPIPSEEEAPPNQSGNLGSLGLAGGSTLSTNTQGDDDGLAGKGKAVKTPSTKRCVGNPPRQSEDPLSPPCVASFSGDNGGAVYPGVTKDEIRILFFYTGVGHLDIGSRGTVGRPSRKYYDAGQEPANPEEEPYPVEVARVYQRYFNDRYQTYNRRAHIFVYFSEAAGPEDLRADAVDNYNKVKPFAVVISDELSGQDITPYILESGRRGVLNFGAYRERRADAFKSYPKQIWGFRPTMEYRAQLFASYICAKAVPHTTSFGDPTRIGRTRKFGMIYGDSPFTANENESTVLFAKMVRPLMEKCGANIYGERPFPSYGGIGYNKPNDDAMTTAFAEFANQGVTTVLWTGGFNQTPTQSATKAGYLPEWIVAGDGELEDIATSLYQDQNQWDNAWVATDRVLEGPRREEACFVAAKDAYPNLPLSDSSLFCQVYDNVRQLFTGIQVAGPRLTPDSVDRGFHAIPAVSSDNPKLPACYYEAGDYTCIKDAEAMWWDSKKQSTYTRSGGCWRAAENGKRYVAGKWPSGDILAQKNANTDPCNAYFSGRYLHPSPGSDSPPTQ